MIYTKLTRRAMNLAYAAHHGQTDKSGVPYIFHPIAVAEQMTDENSTCAALLHDVVEDSGLSIETIRELFPAEVADAVELLTHDKTVTYEEYLDRIKTNEIATKVKIADVMHNSDPSRLCEDIIGKETVEKLTKKYKSAKEILGIS